MGRTVIAQGAGQKGYNAQKNENETSFSNMDNIGSASVKHPFITRDEIDTT